MHRVLLLIAVLLVIPLLGSDSSKEYDDRVKVDDLQGTWLTVAWEPALLRVADHGEMIYTFRDGSWWTCLVAEPVGAYTVDTTHYPARLDKTEFREAGKVQTCKCIYRRDGDTLRIATTFEAGRRPRSFDDKDIFIVTYQRIKK